MKIKLKNLQCVTNAPVDYDWGWATTLIFDLFEDDRGRKYRLVQNEDQYHFDCQNMRYQSGNFAVITDQNDLDYRLSSELITELDNPKVIYRKSFDFEHVFESEDKDSVNRLSLIVDEIHEMKDVKFTVHNGGLSYQLEVVGNEDKFNEIVGQLKPFEK